MARSTSLADLTKQSQPRLKIRVERWLPWLVTFGSFSLNFLTARFSSFDGLYGQDAYAYFVHAAELREHGSLFHHWQWEAEPRLLFWPLGYPALVALLFLITGVSAQAAQLVSILALAGTAGLTSALTLRLNLSSTPQSRYLAALFAGSAVTLSPLGRQAALTVMSDATALFFTCLALWLTIEYYLSKRGLLLIAAAIALGFAATTRYAALTILPALLIPLIYDLCTQRVPAIYDYKKARLNASRATNQSGQLKIRPKGMVFGQDSKFKILFAVLTLGLVVLPQAVINFAWPQPFWNHPWLTGWSPLNFIHTSFDTPDGHAAYNASPLVFYGLEPFLNLRFLTPFIIPLALAGFIKLWQKQRQSWQGWTLVLWWLGPLLFYSGMPYENERFTLTLLPPIAAIAAIGITALYEQIATYFDGSQKSEVGSQKLETRNYRFKIQNSKFAPKGWSSTKIQNFILLLGLVGLGWAGQRHMEGFFAFKNRELATARATEQILPSNARLVTFGISLTYDHYYPSRPVSDLFTMTEADFARLASQGNPLYLLVEPEVIQTQFTGTPTGTIYQLVRTHAPDPPLLQIGRYQLWKIEF